MTGLSKGQSGLGGSSGLSSTAGLYRGQRGLSGDLGSSGPSYDPDATTLFARMSVQPSTEQKQAYDYFVVQAKLLGVWTKIIDCGFCGGHDRQSSLLGFKNAINLTQVGTDALHYAGYGFRGNGTSQAFDTGYKFPVGRQNDASIGMLSLSTGQSALASLGNTDTTLIIRNTGDQSFHRVNGAASSALSSQLDATGFYVVNRLSSTTQKLWKNGTSIQTSSSTSATPDATYNIWFGGRNGASPVYGLTYTNFWFIGEGIPEASIPAFSTLVQEVCARLTASYRAMANATAETKTLYTEFIKMTRQQSYWFGGFDNTDWALGNTPVLPTDIYTITGRYPKVLAFEWADPLRSGGSAVTTAQIARIKAHYARGGVIWLHQHPTNPVTNATGNLYGDPGTAGTPGSQYDLTGSPVLNCLTGGTKRTQYLAWIDRLIVFLGQCTTDAGVKIPIVLRFFHEINGGFFWWTDTGSATRTKQLQTDFIQRLSDAGVNNVLIDFNQNYGNTVDSTYYPGEAYNDIVSGDWYSNGSSPVTGIGGATYNSLSTAITYRKPKWFAECGYQTAADTEAGLWTTKTGTYHRNNLWSSAGFLVWRSPYGPSAGGTTNADVVSMVADPLCITVAP